MALKSQTGTAVVPVANTAGSMDTSGTPTQSNTFTIADVAQHNDINSCWFVVNGNVRDATQFIPMHPGGKQGILSPCGRDGTSAFESQRDG